MGYYWDLFRAIIDPTYVPEQYRRPLPPPPRVASTATPQQQQQAHDDYRRTLNEIRRQDNEYNEGFQRVARNTETAMVGTAQVIAGTGGFLVGGPGGAILAAETVEAGVNIGNTFQGTAPVRSPIAMIGPTGDFGPVGNTAMDAVELFGMRLRGDAHYQNGGGPNDHPVVLERQRRLGAIRENARREAFARHGLNPDGTRNGEAPEGANAPGSAPAAGEDQSMVGRVTSFLGFNSGPSQSGPSLLGIPLGMGSLLGAGILGAIGFFVGGGPIGGFILGAVGGLAGQTILKAITGLSRSTPNPAVSNVPASQPAAPVPMTAVAPPMNLPTPQAVAPVVPGRS